MYIPGWSFKSISKQIHQGVECWLDDRVCVYLPKTYRHVCVCLCMHVWVIKMTWLTFPLTPVPVCHPTSVLASPGPGSSPDSPSLAQWAGALIVQNQKEENSREIYRLRVRTNSSSKPDPPDDPSRRCPAYAEQSTALCWRTTGENRLLVQ